MKQKLLKLVFCVLIAFSLTAFGIMTCAAFDGDVDGNGVVNINDVLVMLKGVTSGTLTEGDMNGDGKIDITDVLVALKNVTAVKDTPTPKSVAESVKHPQSTYRIMTYNLACLVSEDVNGENECIKIIKRFMPDIMGLQECKANVHKKVLSKLPDVYEFTNEYHKNGTTLNYTPIIYNKNVLKCLESELVWLRGRYTGTNTKSLNWAVFEDKEGKRFALINFHGAVCSNSYSGFEDYTKQQLTAQALEWKLDNVAQTLEVVDSIKNKYGNIAIMISGDHNFNSSSQPYANLVAKGFFDAEHTARIERTTGYKTSYTYGKTAGEGLSIDHIFGDSGVDFVAHHIVRDADVWKASDHCPVYVDFNLK